MRLVSVREVAESIRQIDDPVLRGKVHKALHMLRRTLELYRHSDISLSFNGGKDSTVLLHLMRVALHPELDLMPVNSQVSDRPLEAFAERTSQDLQQQCQLWQQQQEQRQQQHPQLQQHEQQQDQQLQQQQEQQHMQQLQTLHTHDDLQQQHQQRHPAAPLSNGHTSTAEGRRLPLQNVLACVALYPSCVQ
eukprot:GHRR01022060.1.p1 GENE.GHRR01022060.1~~GHRR01022060.1.p1  ORF type:complete len:191 (+),score=79.25 GHRR01022060.1:242-814(+)